MLPGCQPPQTPGAPQVSDPPTPHAAWAASFAAENIAMGPLLTEAEESLLRSPGHRAAILSPEATHFGVGVASRNEQGFGRVHYVTQIFLRRPELDLPR
jgi:uncharacterized protein YkwD